MRISGKSFSVMVGDLLISVETLSASITSNRTAVMNNGVPNGFVDGDVACAGEIEVDSKNFNLFVEAAKSSGSWQELAPFDITCIAKLKNEEQKHELFGCLIEVSDLINIDAKGAEKSKHKLPFQVTSADFVRINGVPYLAASATDAL